MSICIKIFSPFFDDRKLGATQISLNSITRKKVSFLWNVRISKMEIRVRFFPWTGCGKPHVVFFIIFLFRRKRENPHLDIQTTISRTFWACTHNRDSNSNSIQRGGRSFHTTLWRTQQAHSTHTNSYSFVPSPFRSSQQIAKSWPEGRIFVFFSSVLLFFGKTHNMSNREFLEIISLTLFCPPLLIIVSCFFQSFAFFREINACLFSKIIVFGGETETNRKLQPNPAFPKGGSDKKSWLFYFLCRAQKQSVFFLAFSICPWDTPPYFPEEKKAPPFCPFYDFLFLFLTHVGNGGEPRDYAHANSQSPNPNLVPTNSRSCSKTRTVFSNNRINNFKMCSSIWKEC